MRHEEFHGHFIAHERALFGYLLAATADLHRAEGLLRKTHAALQDGFERFGEGQSFRAWALKIARQKALEERELRGRAGNVLSPEALDVLAEGLEAEAPALAPRAEFLQPCLGQLAGPSREMVDLRYRDGLSIAGLAERLRRSAAAIETALARVRRFLRECVEKKLSPPKDGESASGDLDLLAERYLGGAAGEEDARRLDDLVRRDARARRSFLVALDEDAALRRLVFVEAAPKEIEDIRAAVASLAAGAEAPPPDRKRSASWKSWVLPAAGLLLLFLAFWSLRGGGEQGGPRTSSEEPRPEPPRRDSGAKPAPPPRDTGQARPVVPDEVPPVETPPAPEAPKTYHFGTAARHTLIQFEGKTPVGTLAGCTRKVSGSATLDFAAGEGKTRIAVPVKSMTTGIPPVDEAMMSMDWLNEAGFPSIELEAEGIVGAGDPRAWRMNGRWTMRGVTKELAIQKVSVVPIPPELAARARLGEGEWIHVRASFQVRLSDHGIGARSPQAYPVGDAWTVGVDLFATTERPPEAGLATLPARIPRGTARPPDVEPPEGPGKLYRLGRHPQFTNVRAEQETEAGTMTAFTKILGGWLRIDHENGTGAAAVVVPAESITTGIEEMDNQLHGPFSLDGRASSDLRFESTRAVRKDDTTWTVEGVLLTRDSSQPVVLEATMLKIAPAQMLESGLGGKEALGLVATFRAKIFNEVLRMKPDWTVKLDLLAEAEE